MKKIIMLALTGVFLALFVLVIQEKENRRIQMEELFSKSANPAGTTVEKIASPAVENKESLPAVSQNKRPVVGQGVKSRSASRNEEIKRALKIKPREASREEIKKILIRYRRDEKSDKGYSRLNDSYDSRKYDGWSGKKYDHDDDDDGYEEDDD